MLLARPQYDAAFVGLLVAQDENTWVPKYGKAGWAAEAIHQYFLLRYYKDTPRGRKLKNVNVKRRKQTAKWVGVTPREYDATIAEVVGEQPPPGCTSADRIEALPTPGGALPYLKGGPFEELGRRSTRLANKFDANQAERKFKRAS